MTEAAAPPARSPASPSSELSPLRTLRLALLAISVVFYALHFLHLTADFPNNSPWSDWSKYTDEGWYSDAAVRHFLFGHWYLPGDFNPAVALPVWPLLEAAVFRFTGVSLAAARALTVAVFGVMLLALWRLIERMERGGDPTRDVQRTSLAAPFTVLFLSVSPFLYAFDRQAILEPLLAALGVLALLTAAHCTPWSQRQLTPFGTLRALLPPLALGLLLPAMVLTKPTAVTLFPSVACLLWYRAGRRFLPWCRLALPPVLLGVALWLCYFFLLVRPHFLEDYQYLFDANAYTGFQLEPLATVVFHTVADGNWIGGVVYPLCFGLLAILLFARPRFFRNPLVPALLVWMAAYFLFLGYHNNLQPRYYLLLAVPATTLVALALEELRSFAPGSTPARGNRSVRLLLPSAVALCIVAIALPDALQQLRFILHPEYTYLSAAQALARTVRADPSHPSLLLSVSGSDLTLMTGLPSIDDDFGTLDLDQRVATYHPGWYAAWNELDDDKMDAILPLYHPVRVAAFPALDDPDRNLLILYRLDPATQAPPRRHNRGRIPRQLRIRRGQQPTTTQLKH